MRIVRPFEKLCVVAVSFLPVVTLLFTISGCSASPNSSTPDPRGGASIAVSVSPTATSAAVGGGKNFTATVQNDAQNKGVTWSLSGAGCSGATCGTLSNLTVTGATYNAPSAVPNPALVTLTATSISDGTKSAAAAITITANPVVSVSISPGSSSLQAGIGTAAFTASVTNDSQNKGVTWSLAGSGCAGASCGTLSSATATSVTYNAPASLPSPATITLTATSAADTSKTASATLTVTAPINVSVSPASVSLNISGTQQFTATVQNDSQNLGVTWSVNGVVGGSATAGTISTSGVYTAPASVPGPSVTVTAKSNADTNRSGSATVTVLAAVSVNVAPASPSIQLNQSQGFTASVSNDPGNQGVNWSLSGAGCSGTTCGTLSNVTATSVTYTAPVSLPSPASVTLTAASKRDGSKSAAATITLSAAAGISVTVSPTAPSVVTGATQSFTATLQNDSQNKGVNWSLSGAGCSGTACGTLSNVTTTTVTYNAPATVPSPATVTLTATSIADGTKTAAATITVTTSSTNISVTVSPKRGGLTTSQTLPTITATLTNDTANQGVTWSFTSTGSAAGGGFLPTSSKSGASVVFTAPSAAGVVTITATAVADNTKTATATIGVTDLLGVTTYHNNLSRDGTNTKEYALTTSNVTASSFGKLFSCTVDGAIYAQPLWIPKLSVGGGGGTHNVVLVATMRDSVYLFDADNPCTTYWSKTLIPAGETYGSYADLGSSDIFPDVGILGTPVIDPSTNAVYLVTKTKSTSTGNYVQRLHALNLADGSERSNSPVTVDSSVSVSGNCDFGTSVVFDAQLQNQRAGLALINSVVFVAWASHGDQGAYHGWVIGYNPSTLARASTLNTTPNRSTGFGDCKGGIWMSGGAPAADIFNNIYLMTGNGAFDPPISDYSDSYLKLSSSLAVSDYFTPHNQLNLNGGDWDVGAGGTALLIDQTSGPVAHLLVGAGKIGTFYVLNRDNMGKYNPSDAGAVQTWATNSNCFSTPAFWNNTMYHFGTGFGTPLPPGAQYAFNASTGQFNTTPVKTTPGVFGFPGATPSVSSTGNSNGIVWAIDSSNYGTNDGGSLIAGPAVLHAYDASNISTELWNSTQGAGNTAGNAVKFTVPTVANGKVYIGTRGNDTTTGSGTVFGQLDVYGLLPN